ncbi:MAG TPA: class I SAM-dependent methyltransferase [Caulobacteraceae bacterium]|jgi:demethylmenaquinone methyltransferase/2-methoxy-6-polyprenyl-1,4-benzoquinol methylase|nr:class I SAM-dependent methyltransferase [Caulobacteraceae bacterium]
MSQTSASFGFKDVDPAEKPRLVRGVFDSVARRYDLMNDLMSAGVHRVWKDIAAVRLNPQPGETIIDCAGGTGDMARRLARLAAGARKRRGGAAAEVIVIDYNAEMLGVGRERETAPEIVWSVGDAQALPLPDASADAYMIAFGIRNVADVAKALSEARRVLKPGGRFVCLEFSRPVTEALASAYDAYSFKVIPQVGEWIAGDREAYQYLVESIRRFPDQASFAGLMRAAGFANVAWTNLTGGVAAVHQGWAIGAP